MSINLSKINLSKITLEKVAEEYGIGEQKARIALVIDISGSMSSMMSDGSVQELIERVIPIAMKFDDDQMLEVFLFTDRAYKCASITVNELDNFVKNKIINKYDMSSTKYAKAINMISNQVYEDYVGVSSNIFSGIFGSSKKDEKILYNTAKFSTDRKKEATPMYVLFVTDGENDFDDKNDAKNAMIESSRLPIFWQFVGIGGNTKFDFLEKLDDMSGRMIDNADFINAGHGITGKIGSRMTDDQLYKELLKEFPSWLKNAKNKDLI